MLHMPSAKSSWLGSISSLKFPRLAASSFAFCFWTVFAMVIDSMYPINATITAGPSRSGTSEKVMLCEVQDAHTGHQLATVLVAAVSPNRRRSKTQIWDTSQRPVGNSSLCVPN